jgi:hypothetical protein
MAVAADMDIEMDLDVGLMDEDVDVAEVEIIPDANSTVSLLGSFLDAWS